MNITAGAVAVVAGVAGAGVLSYFLWKKAGNVGEAVASAAGAVNPLNPNNVFVASANSVVTAVTGRDETLGGWVYDVTHADPFASKQTAPAAAPASAASPNLASDGFFTYDAMGNITGAAY